MSHFLLRTWPLEALKKLRAKGGASQKEGDNKSTLTASQGKSELEEVILHKKSYQYFQLATVDQAALTAAAAD